MRSAHTVEQVRAAEAALMAQVPEGALMQRAASGLAVAIADLLGHVYAARVLLLVGAGDNGGDALWAGAVLARRGAAVEAVLLSSKVHEEGLAALRANGGRAVLASEAHHPDVVVDGIVGIGGRPGLHDEAAEALALFEGVPVVAVDVPSGVEVDTGRLPDRHVRADLTVTFGTHKIAHLVDPAAQACGVVHLVDIGLDLPEAPLEALQPLDVAALVPVPDPFGHKYTRGVVGVRAGSEAYPGAAVLCTSGAVSGLAGMVRYSGSAADAVRARHPEIVASEGRVQAWVVGSGGDTAAEAALADALADGVPTVVDADALMHVEPGPRGLVLTPHAGELARMLDVDRTAVEAEQLAFARRAAAEYDAVVLLKGRHTLVARPDGRVRVTTSGVPWLAVAGAGDVLAGVIGSLLAAGLDPWDAASAGSWLHGAAAAQASGGGPLTATRVADAIPEVVRGLTP
jgi:ADP-dependent NAD(P)H-hydrate dehydratase / NAD(P)H-hydrate epimerase